MDRSRREGKQGMGEREGCVGEGGGAEGGRRAEFRGLLVLIVARTSSRRSLRGSWWEVLC